MYDHIGLRTPNLAKALAFFEAALAPLGHELTYQDDATAGFGKKDGATGLWLHGDAKAGTGAHVAFTAPSRDAVDAFYAAAMAAGGTDNGIPGLRADYSPTYYAAFVIDPDGNNVEAVCTV